MNFDKRTRKPITDEPLTFKRINEAIEHRLSSISLEFSMGFDFIKKLDRTVTFFGSARTMPGEKDYEKARELAKRIATEIKYDVVTGGGPGIMEAANRGAFEAGGRSYGMSIKLPIEQVTNPYVHRTMTFHYFFSRKVCLMFSAEAYVFFPGGYGTLDEFFELITLVQTHKIEPVPIILVGTKYWKELYSYLNKNLCKQDRIDPEDIELFTITDDLDEIIEIIKKAPVRTMADTTTQLQEINDQNLKNQSDCS
jgi:uncharacterized protein (TIGR00730 family)